MKQMTQMSVGKANCKLHRRPCLSNSICFQEVKILLSFPSCQSPHHQLLDLTVKIPDRHSHSLRGTVEGSKVETSKVQSYQKDLQTNRKTQLRLHTDPLALLQSYDWRRDFLALTPYKNSVQRKEETKQTRL